MTGSRLLANEVTATCAVHQGDCSAGKVLRNPLSTKNEKRTAASGEELFTGYP